jgi:hypothetical protein
MIARLWRGRAADRRNAEEPERAVVEPQARAVLAEYDDFVRHYEVVE